MTHSISCSLSFPALAAALGLLLFPGCASLSPASDPMVPEVVATPSHWQAPTPPPAGTATSPDVADLTSWWKRFDDQNLIALIEQALDTSPDLLTARSRIAVAQAQRDVSRAGLFPSLTASLSGSGNETRDHDTGTTTNSESFSVGLNTSWEVDLFGSQRASTIAATADWQQSIDTFHAVQVSLSAEVATTYLNLRAAEARLDLNHDTRLSRASSLQLTQWRHDAGLDDTLAVTQARTALAQIEAAIPPLQQAVASFRNQLTVLCGLPPGSLDALLGTSTKLPSAPVAVKVGLPAATMLQRPDVQAAALAVEAAAARLTSAERDRLPSLNLTGTLTASSSSAGKLIDPATTAANLLGSLTTPLFDAGRIRQNIRIQDELTQQAVLAYQSSVVSALAEVEDALVALDRTQARHAALLDAQTSAITTRDLAHQRYAAGQIDYLQVLDADRTLLALDDSVLTAQADQIAAQIQLYRALGGGWAPLPGTAIATTSSFSE